MSHRSGVSGPELDSSSTDLEINQAIYEVSPEFGGIEGGASVAAENLDRDYEAWNNVRRILIEHKIDPVLAQKAASKLYAAFTDESYLSDIDSDMYSPEDITSADLDMVGHVLDAMAEADGFKEQAWYNARFPLHFRASRELMEGEISWDEFMGKSPVADPEFL